MNWTDVLEHEPVYLNLGGNGDCHPNAPYAHYIAVDLAAAQPWAVRHDLRQPIPLPDGSVTRILTEHFLEHLDRAAIAALLTECCRVLKPDGLMRLAVPDYANPKTRRYLRRGRDPKHGNHLTLPTYPLMKALVESSPFARHTFYHYWDGDTFVQEPVDYSLGMVRRTPDNDRRCRRAGFGPRCVGLIRDVLFVVSRAGFVRRIDLQVQRGHPLRVTSIVADLYKR